ncbi:hypothetical protein GCM10023257_51030 [Streptomyces hyderabadensis]|uniref:Uncharacterized protein n=1 Tax=Streptomyces hyderabadensis TaxID=598549 RepID=A0ABP9IKC6_9ACTN
MPRRGQRDPQPGRPERPQPPQRQRETDRGVFTRQPRHPVHGVLAGDRDRGVVRRYQMGNKGISPGGKAPCAWFREHPPTLRTGPMERCGRPVA